MVITYKKANDRFQKLYDRWSGVRYGMCRAFRVGNKICITHNGKPILWIDKKNQYEFTSMRSEVQRKFYNQFTPITIRKRKAEWYVGRMPYHIGMKVNSKGEYIIPDVWPGHNYMHHCVECNEPYTNERCIDCHREYINGEARW